MGGSGHRRACYNTPGLSTERHPGAGTPTQQGATAAYKWTFTPAQSAEDTIKTFTVEQGSSVRAGRFAYGLVTQLGVKFDRSGVAVTGAMLGHAYEDGVTMTGTPAAIAVQPIQPTEVSVYMDTTGASIGTTKLTRVLRAEFEIGDRYSPLWTLNSAANGLRHMWRQRRQPR